MFDILSEVQLMTGWILFPAVAPSFFVETPEIAGFSLRRG